MKATDSTRDEIEQQVEADFVEMVRDMAREGGVTEPLSDEEAKRILDHFFPPDFDCPPLPPEGTPEFDAEMQRRLASDHPALSARNIVAFLRASPRPKE